MKKALLLAVSFLWGVIANANVISYIWKSDEDNDKVEYTVYYHGGDEQKIHYYNISGEVELEEITKSKKNDLTEPYERFKAENKKFEFKCNDKDIVFIVTTNENGTVNLEVQYDESQKIFEDLAPITKIDDIGNNIFLMDAVYGRKIFYADNCNLISTIGGTYSIDETQIIYLKDYCPRRCFICNEKTDSEKPFVPFESEDIEITAVQNFDKYYLIHYIESFLPKVALQNIETHEIKQFPEEVAEYDLRNKLLHIREKDSILFSYYRPKNDECLLDFSRTGDKEKNLSLIFSPSKSLKLPKWLTNMPIIEEVESFDRDYNIPVFIWGQTKEPKGTIVFIHGGPWFHEGYKRSIYLNPLIKLGYKLIVPELIGSTGNGYKYSELGMHENSLKKKLQDLKKILATYAEGEKLIVIGFSYGAYLVNCAAVGLKDVTDFSNYVSKFISLAGIWDICEFLKDTKLWNLRENCLIKRFQIGTDPSNESINQLISPIFYLKNIEVPITIVHGKDDRKVPISQIELLEELEENSDIKIIKIKGEGHHFDQTQQIWHIFKPIF